MSTVALRFFGVAALVLMTSAGLEANDIVDILRVVNALTQDRPSGRSVNYAGGSRGRSGWAESGVPMEEVRMHGARTEDRANRTYSMGYGSGNNRSTHDAGREYRSAEQSNGYANGMIRNSDRDRSRVAMREDSFGERRANYGSVSGNRDMRVTFQVQSATPYAERAYAPVVPGRAYVPAVPAPVYRVPAVPVMPYRIGEFVRSPVPLATCVQVKDLCNAAPDAVPAILAVRDPHCCEHDLAERVVYVEVLVPRCPLQKLEVSKCGTRVDLCFGEYDIEVRSRNGVVTVQYDN